MPTIYKNNESLWHRNGEKKVRFEILFYCLVSRVLLIQYNQGRAAVRTTVVGC